MESDQHLTTDRRNLLNKLATIGTVTVAGCLGEENKSSNTDNLETNKTPQGKTPKNEQQSPSFQTPESDHVDLDEFVKEWGTFFESHNRSLVDSFSPSQLNDKYDITWIEGKQASELYSMFPFSHTDIPESIAQETPNYRNSSYLKIDQLPNDTSKDDIIEALESEGYEKESKIGSFEIYTIIDEPEARAVGEERHLVSFNSTSHGPSTNSQVEFIGKAIEQYRDQKTSLDSDVIDCIENIEVKDSLLTVNANAKFLRGVSSDYQPEVGAVTVDFENEIQESVWKFEDEQTTDIAYDIITGSDYMMRNGFTQAEKSGRFLRAEGGYELKDNFDFSQNSAKPLI